MTDIKVIKVSSNNKKIAEECNCCYNITDKFKDYGCHHKVCIECHNTMNKKLGRTTCLYCNPLENNNVVINVTPDIYPINDVVINYNFRQKNIRILIIDIICFTISCYGLILFGYFCFNFIKYINSDEDDYSSSDIFKLDKFSLDKAIYGLIYLLIFTYIVTTFLLLVLSRVGNDDEDHILCKATFYIFDKFSKYYRKFIKKICCIN